MYSQFKVIIIRNHQVCQSVSLSNTHTHNTKKFTYSRQFRLFLLTSQQPYDTNLHTNDCRQKLLANFAICSVKMWCDVMWICTLPLQDYVTMIKFIELVKLWVPPWTLLVRSCCGRPLVQRESIVFEPHKYFCLFVCNHLKSYLKDKLCLLIVETSQTLVKW